MAIQKRERAHATRLITVEKRDADQSGTALANYTITPSCNLDTPDPPANGWGGARNRHDRTSLNLSERQCHDMVAAATYALSIGLPFNRHWTVHYERAGIADQDGAAFVGRLLRLASAHIRRAGGRLAAIWARENGDGKGCHVHILLHVTAGVTLRNRTRRWIVAAGGRYRNRVSRVKVIGGTLASANTDCLQHRNNMAAVLSYLMKGASNVTGEVLGLPRSGEGGRIIGKRAGWTQNIGRAAQGR